MAGRDSSSRRAVYLGGLVSGFGSRQCATVSRSLRFRRAGEASEGIVAVSNGV